MELRSTDIRTSAVRKTKLLSLTILTQLLINFDAYV